MTATVLHLAPRLQAQALDVLFDAAETICLVRNLGSRRDVNAGGLRNAIRASRRNVADQWFVLNPLAPGAERTTKADILHARNVLVEFDHCGLTPEEQADRWSDLLPWACVTSSAGKSCHFILSMKAPFPSHAHAELWTRQVLYPWCEQATGFAPDRACHNVNRLSRTPGGLRDLNEARPQTIFRVGSRIALVDLPEPLRQLPRPSERKVHFSPAKPTQHFRLSAVHPKARRWLAGQVDPDGNRRLDMLMVSRHLVAAGADLEQACEVLRTSEAYRILGWSDVNEDDVQLIRADLDKLARGELMLEAGSPPGEVAKPATDAQPLEDVQAELAQTFDSWRDGWLAGEAPRAVLAAPTGTGKNYQLCRHIGEAVTHRQTLQDAWQRYARRLRTAADRSILSDATSCKIVGQETAHRLHRRFERWMREPACRGQDETRLLRAFADSQIARRILAPRPPLIVAVNSYDEADRIRREAVEMAGDSGERVARMVAIRGQPWRLQGAYFPPDKLAECRAHAENLAAPKAPPHKLVAHAVRKNLPVMRKACTRCPYRQTCAVQHGADRPNVHALPVQIWTKARWQVQAHNVPVNAAIIFDESVAVAEPVALEAVRITTHQGLSSVVGDALDKLAAYYPNRPLSEDEAALWRESKLTLAAARDTIIHKAREAISGQLHALHQRLRPDHKRRPSDPFDLDLPDKLIDTIDFYLDEAHGLDGAELPVEAMRWLRGLAEHCARGAPVICSLIRDLTGRGATGRMTIRAELLYPRNLLDGLAGRAALVLDATAHLTPHSYSGMKIMKWDINDAVDRILIENAAFGRSVGQDRWLREREQRQVVDVGYGDALRGHLLHQLVAAAERAHRHGRLDLENPVLNVLAVTYQALGKDVRVKGDYWEPHWTVAKCVLGQSKGREWRGFFGELVSAELARIRERTPDYRLPQTLPDDLWARLEIDVKWTYYGHGTEGTNRYQDRHVIIGLGTPSGRNDLQEALYALQYGNLQGNLGRELYGQAIARNARQLEGRLRAARRPAPTYADSSSPLAKPGDGLTFILAAAALPSYWRDSYTQICPLFTLDSGKIRPILEVCMLDLGVLSTQIVNAVRLLAWIGSPEMERAVAAADSRTRGKNRYADFAAMFDLDAAAKVRDWLLTRGTSLPQWRPIARCVQAARASLWTPANLLYDLPYDFMLTVSGKSIRFRLPRARRPDAEFAISDTDHCTQTVRQVLKDLGQQPRYRLEWRDEDHLGERVGTVVSPGRPVDLDGYRLVQRNLAALFLMMFGPLDGCPVKPGWPQHDGRTARWFWERMHRGETGGRTRAVKALLRVNDVGKPTPPAGEQIGTFRRMILDAATPDQMDDAMIALGAWIDRALPAEALTRNFIPDDLDDEDSLALPSGNKE